MDGFRFKIVTRKLEVAIERRSSIGFLLGSSLALIGLDGSEAKRKNKKKKRKKNKKKKRPAPQSPPAPPASPPPPAPVARVDATCVVTDAEGSGAGFARVAQTFRAVRSGQLTSASVLLRSNGAAMDFDIEIWTVNEQNGAPAAFLTGTVITDVPATMFPNSRPLTATFPNPAPVVGGTRYALVITKGDNANFVASFANICPDGMVFLAGDLDDPWFPTPGVDLHFETIVVA